MMRYLSVCSGIEAATVAWHPLGWTPAAFSEIDVFPRAVLAHHYPAVPLHGDFTTMRGDEYGAIDLLVGGTPCQDFSIAGLRAGIAGDRGNLTLEFLRLASRAQPRWIVWENVPGVLSSDSGRALGAFLGGLAELGYGFAYRVLDAQYFELAQRRARVFVVAHLGDWRRAAAVLFERESLLWDSAPSRETGERVAPTISARTKGGGGLGTDFDCDGGLIAPPITSNPYGDHESREGLLVPMCMSSGQANAEITRDGSPSLTCLHEAPIVAHAFKASHFTRGKDDALSVTVPPLSADADKGDQDTLIAFSVKDHGADAGPLATSVRAGGFDKSHANGGVMPAVCFDTTQIASKANRSQPRAGDPAHPLAAGAHPPAIAFAIQAGALKENPAHGPDGVGVRGDDAAFTLEARAEVQAVAFESRFARNGRGAPDTIVPPLKAQSGQSGKGDAAPLLATSMQVRRLTPRECERLQGFPDGYTDIPWRKKNWTPDGPRYKALGNSMAVPVMAWIGKRIAMVEAMTAEPDAHISASLHNLAVVA